MPEPRKLRVFLCHASQDKPAVHELYQRLSAEGWINPWLDEKNLLPGQDWEMEIEKAVEAADAVVVCLSNNSITKEGYIQKELRFVLRIADEKPEGKIFVIPVRLENCSVPRRLGSWQRVDYFPDEQKDWAYDQLLKSMRVGAEERGIEIIIPVVTKSIVLTNYERQSLIDLANVARNRAYVPYSRYPVGAAIRAKSGKVFTGVNVENAAYPQTMCAERVAIFKAVSEGEKEFEAIAVVTDNGGSPCGGCRQVMAEFGLDTVVLMADGAGDLIEETTVGELLPEAFTPGKLAR